MRYNLNQSPKRHILYKPKKYKLINPQFLTIIFNSEFYNSSFDDPFSNGLKLEDLNYRCTIDQKEIWVESIVNNDPRIVRVKEKKNFVVLTCKSTNSGPTRYITFYDDKKSLMEGESTNDEKEKDNIKIEKKKDRLHNVQNKSRVKRKGIGKSRRK